MDNITFQYEFRPELPNIYGASDYREFRDTLAKMDEILAKSGLEDKLILDTIKQQSEDNEANTDIFPNTKELNRQHKILKHALRCNIARHLTSESYRAFSIRLADSTLFQWFTGINDFGSRKATSKSTLERYEKHFDADKVFGQIQEWLSGFSETSQSKSIGLAAPIDFSDIFLDTTCVKGNIHFPVDWVLLRDAARSLLLAITSIRAQGLKHRMIEPSSLIKEMNKLCIKMTHTRRKKDSKRQRKIILRLMKKLMHRIEKHAKRYRKLLLDKWPETQWSDAQMQVVIGRIDNVLEQLPVAIKQAHDRIIGERLVPNNEKILSLYDKDMHVIIRGKASGEVEFGQGLLLAEQRDGLIVNCELFKDAPPSDSKLLKPAITTIQKYFGRIASATGDRGFSSPANDKFLKEQEIKNGVCPKSPKVLEERLRDAKFVSLQTRRSQTEARIGIFKNVFLGKPLRSRITAYKRHAVNWCVLTHNLWVLARKAISDEQSMLQKAA